MDASDGQDQPQSGGDQPAATKPGQDDNRKLFVAGLLLDTTEQQIKDHFGQYGDIQSVALKTNVQTGKSKGFAFVVYTSEESMNKALAVKDHKINGKAVDVKKAKAKPGKVFVGGIKPELTEDDIKEHFGQYGNVTQIDMPFDKTKNQRRTFCFVTFESELVVRDLLKSPKQKIKDVMVDVKRATPQQDSWGGGGGGWGGAGGWGQGGYGGGGGYGDWYGYDGYGGGYGPGGYGGGYTDFGGGYGPGGGYGGGPGYGGPGYGGPGGYGGGGFGGKPGRGRGRGRGARQKPY